MSYYVSIITLTWPDSCTNKWPFSTSTSYHPKFEWATLPSFRHFRHLHSSLKGFDSGIRMQGYCLVQCSGVHQQVLADQWSVRTIWIARWKGIDNLNIFEHRPGSFGRVFNTFQRACEIWYRLIMMNRWAMMYPSSPWRGETAASRDGNFRRVPCFIQSLNVQHSQISVTFVTFTHPERVLILGSGCKDIALYNVQGSISRSWQMSGQCNQSASRGEHRPGSFERIFNTWERVFVIWYRWSIMYPSSPWRGETAWSPNLIFFLEISAWFCVHHGFVSQLLKWHVLLSKPLLIEGFHGWQLCKNIAQNCLWRRDPFTSATETCNEFWRWRR